MELADLSVEGRVALAGLVRLMVSADHSRSDAEMAEFRAIAEEMGKSAFDGAFQEALTVCATEEATLEFAKRVPDADSRQLILTVLVDLAAADGITNEERELVRAVAAGWDLPVRV